MQSQTARTENQARGLDACVSGTALVAASADSLVLGGMLFIDDAGHCESQAVKAQREVDQPELLASVSGFDSPQPKSLKMTRNAKVELRFMWWF